MRRVIRATLNSWNGLCTTARSEAAFREEMVLLAVAMPLAWWIARNPWQMVALVGVVLLVMLVELLNTAIEKLADAVTLDQHPKIRFAKDAGSAAVAVALVLAALVWGVAVAEFAGLF